MRRLMWFTLGFGAACLLLAVLTAALPLWIPGTALVCAGLIAGLMGLKYRRAVPAALLLLGLGCGCFRFHWAISKELKPLNGLDG